MIDKQSWKTFQDAGLLWWVNRGLHLFGWAIVFEQAKDGTITDVYPARVKFRGFSADVEEKGFKLLTAWLADHTEDLVREADG